MPDFLHRRKDFDQLLSVVADKERITTTLVEKDYWITHCLWGLKQQEFEFELKGGTSLSKGFGIIKRFSEDIDIRFEPPEKLEVMTGKNQNSPRQIESRRLFYEWLAKEIEIPDVTVSRATEYDDSRFRNAGILLIYETRTKELEGVKPAVLLEVGFDDTTPNTAVDISSWALDAARASGADFADNQAQGILCYNPEYTFVEKLQTISTKYRKFKETGRLPSNFLRHYSDVCSLLDVPSVLEFIGTGPYEERKKQRFPSADEQRIAKNPAFLFENKAEFEQLDKEYRRTAALYYAGQTSLADIASKVRKYIDKL